jgi:hypothetical protein
LFGVPDEKKRCGFNPGCPNRREVFLGFGRQRERARVPGLPRMRGKMRENPGIEPQFQNRRASIRLRRIGRGNKKTFEMKCYCKNFAEGL